MRAPTGTEAAVGAPAAALLFNSMVWGLSWWPMRQLQAAGLHPLWATALIFALAVVVIGSLRPAAWRELATRPSLWIIVAAAGTTNASFNWGITVGDVVRVVLLFYLMPLWTVVLARLVLGEAITGLALLRVALALAGALCVLWPADGRSPFGPGGNPVDLLGLLGGFSFAVNNIMLRRPSAAGVPGADSRGGRALAMFLGGCLVSLALTRVLPDLPDPPVWSWHWGAWVATLTTCYLASNLLLQYGATRLPANATSVIMLTEVLWAAGSAIALGAGTASLPLFVGGGLIIAAAALAALPSRPSAQPGTDHDPLQRL